MNKDNKLKEVSEPPIFFTLFKSLREKCIQFNGLSFNVIYLFCIAFLHFPQIMAILIPCIKLCNGCHVSMYKV